MNGPVTTRSAYVAPTTVATYPLSGRQEHIMKLIVEEIKEMSELPLNVPLPAEPKMAKLCREILDAPSINTDLDTLAHKMGMSRRSFTRLFRVQTGMSFGEWRQQACLLSALTQLSLGKSVTEVALELGYSNTSAFTSSFQRTMSVPPSQYLKLHQPHK